MSIPLSKCKCFSNLISRYRLRVKGTPGYFYARENRPSRCKRYMPKNRFRGISSKGFVRCHSRSRRCEHYNPWLLLESITLSERLMMSCARHRFVAASSRRTDWKVASRKGSGRHWRRASRARALSLSLTIGQYSSPLICMKH